MAVEAGQSALGLFPDGVWFVALAPLSLPEHILTAIAAAINFSFQGIENQRNQLNNFLRDKRLLLILDNLEHLLPEGATYLEDLLQNATEVKLLVTSRQPINAPWEWVYPLHGLDYEVSPVEGRIPAALQLFLQHLSRAGSPAADNDLVCAAQICKIVNGLPLALLLAASWGRVLECDEIIQEIQRGIGFLQTQQKTFPERHSSMQVVFDYSWRLLSEAERAALRKLSVFRGGFDRDAAVQVAGAHLTLFAPLVDQSLIERVSKDHYQIHELLRQYLHEHLVETGEEASARDQHLSYYVQLAKQAEPELAGEQLDKWRKWFKTEIDNIRAAVEWSLDKGEAFRLKNGLSLMLQLGRLWQLHSYLKEGLGFLKRLIAALPDELRPRFYAEGLNLASELSFRIRNYAEARGFAAEVLELGLDLNDPRLVGDAYYRQSLDAFMRNDLTTSHSFAGHAFESYQKIEAPLKTALTLNLFGDIEFYLGNFEDAYRYQLRALDITRTLKDEISMAAILHSLAGLALADPAIGLEKSRRWIEEGLQYARKVNDTTLVQTFLMDLGENLRQERRYEEAITVYEETVQTINDAVPKEEYIVIWLNLGFAYFRAGKHDRSRQIFLDNLAEIQKFKRDTYHELPHCLLGVAGIAVIEGKAQLAATILGSLEAHKSALVFWPTDRSEYEQIYAAVKAQFTEKQFDQLYKEGQALDLADAAQLIQSQGINEKGRNVEQLNQLTKREIEILFLVAQGLSDARIAEKLVLSPRTVNAHITSIYHKLGVNSRAAATRFAIEHGLT